MHPTELGKAPPWYLGHIPGACPYLPGRDWRLLLVDGDYLGHAYRRLLDEGFRRHGAHLYRPDCAECNACQVHRVPLEGFRMSRSQRRCWRKGRAAFDLVVQRPETTPEKVAMYNAYLAFQHGAEAEKVDETRYREFFVDTCLGPNTLEMQLRASETGTLAGVGIVDVVEDALSSVYFYFDPAHARSSPGTFSALAEIDWARSQGLAYYYMGFYIAGCRTMAYKTQFGPCELRTLGAEGWHTPA